MKTDLCPVILATLALTSLGQAQDEQTHSGHEHGPDGYHRHYDDPASDMAEAAQSRKRCG